MAQIDFSTGVRNIYNYTTPSYKSTKREITRNIDSENETVVNLCQVASTFVPLWMSSSYFKAVNEEM